MSQPRERYLILLEALPDEAPAVVRLRRLLKTALRRDRLRCVEAKELPPQEEPSRGPATDP